MHHSGQFVELGGRYYVGGKIDYFDFCEEDEMSLIEIKEMAKELQLTDVACFLHNRGMMNDCNYTHKINDDSDAMCVGNFADNQRVAEIYVEHKNLEELSENETEDGENEHMEEFLNPFPDIDEPIGYVGDVDEPDDLKESDDDEPQPPDDLIEPDGEPLDTGNIGNEPFDLSDGLIDVNDSEGIDEQSVGEDSDHSDFLVDSDFYQSDDDFQYDEHVDFDAEWGGLREEPKTDPIMTRSKKLNTLVEEEISRKKKQDHFSHNQFPVFNEKVDMDDPQFQLGLCFDDADTFREAIRQHSRVHGRDIKLKKNEKNKVQAVCKHKTCEWYVYASQLRDEATFQIKTVNAIHECNRKERVTCATSRWIANKYKDKIVTDPKWPVDSMMSIVQKECKLLFSKDQMYRAKRKAIELNTGSSVQQYGMMWRYASEVVRTNPGTTIRIKTKPVGNELKFKRVYLCWAALREGFLSGCRPIIFLDGCHLKSAYGGILLCAVGIDANNGMYPFAYAVVEKEKKDSWVWFIELLIADLKIENSALWTVMSDKQKGLIDAIQLLMPHAEHRFCVMHLYSNFKLSHRGLALKNILWQAARASRIVDFERVMRELSGKDKSAFQWLAKRPASHWSKSYFSTNSKCDVLLNNMCESFNAMILRARCLPIIDMLEAVRLILMKRIHVKRDKMIKYNGDICPNIQKQIDDLKEKSMVYSALWNGKDQFEVEKNCHGEKFKVHLGEKVCSCRKWQLTGIPCEHAISCMYSMGYEPEDFVEDWYKKETYMKVYNHLMNTMEGNESWPKSVNGTLLPPDIEKMPGRPKLHNRNKKPGESSKDIPPPVSKTITRVGRLGRQGVIMTCSLCHQKKHNAKGCPLRKQSNGNGATNTSNVVNSKRKRNQSRTEKEHQQQNQHNQELDNAPVTTKRKLQVRKERKQSIFEKDPETRGKVVEKTSERRIMPSNQSNVTNQAGKPTITVNYNQSQQSSV